MTTETLDVPGARLYYDIDGSGPVLLLVGVPMDAGGFTAVAQPLAEHHTVVTYDPRGIGRSTREDDSADITPEIMADDLHRLLSKITGEPVSVLGSSGGAVTALALVTKHPEQVHTLVAHEPPLLELLPDRDELRAQTDSLVETFRNEGADAATKAFMAMAGLPPHAGPPPMDALPPEQREVVQRVNEVFYEHLIRPVTRYRPDIAALRSVPTRIVVAGGAESSGQLARRAAEALAEQLGTSIVDFPGDHGGFMGQPEAFAQTLLPVLAQH